VPPVTAAEQLTAWQDARYWHASCFVLASRGQANAGQLRQTMDALFGPGQEVADVTVWRVSAG
jgi:hypothetical protein